MRHKKFSSIGKRLDPKNLYKTNRQIDEIIVHCSASPIHSKLNADGIDRMHMERWKKYSNPGCGYHYIITSKGKLEKGRWADFRGAHAKGNNKYTLGVAYIGGLDSSGKPVEDLLPAKQRDMLITTLQELKKLYPKAVIKGHRELPKVRKLCPCMDMDIVREQVDGRLFLNV